MGLFEAEISPPYHIAPSIRELHIENFYGGGVEEDGGGEEGLCDA